MIGDRAQIEASLRELPICRFFTKQLILEHRSVFL